jgi:uncharacterized protein (DUF302 family)
MSRWRSRRHLPFVVLLAFAAIAAPRAGQAVPPGLVTKKSPYEVSQTLDRLEAALKAQGCATIARLDERAIARKGGEQVAATELLIFSCANFDAAMIKSERRVGLDLPLKALAWEDTNGGVYLTYPAPDRLAQIYGITNQPVAVQHMSDLLDQATDQAVKP